MAAVLTIDPEQRMQALAKANEIRFENAVFTRSLKQHRMWDAAAILAAVLADPDVVTQAIGAAPIYRLLMAIPKFGHARAAKRLRSADILSGDRRVRDLSQRQRDQIAGSLHEKARN